MTEKSQLPNFLTNASKHDWILWWAFALTGIYQLGLIPSRAVLLLNHTFLYAMLTGSGFSLVSLAASNPERIGFLCLSTVLAAASAIKFLPLFYLMGYRWGTEFLHYSFMGHPPRWYRVTERFIYRYFYLMLAAAFIPFSPIPAAILLVLAGIKKMNPWLIGGLAFICAIALKSFYTYLGLRFGMEVQGVLEQANRYINWITIALLAWMFIQIWWKQRKQ